MKMNEKDLDRLFDAARQEKPLRSFDSTRADFVRATIETAGGVAASKSILNLLTKKTWIMLSVITVIAFSTVVLLKTNPDVKTSAIIQKQAQPEIQVKTEINAHLDETEASNKTNFEPEIHLVTNNEKEKELIQKMPLMNLAALSAVKKADVVTKERPHIKSYKERFKIDKSTTLSDLELIKLSANNAGVQFYYKALIEADTLKRLQYSMEINDGSMKLLNRTQIDFTLQDEPYVLGWSTNKDGVATGLGTHGFENEDNTKGVAAGSSKSFPPKMENSTPYAKRFTFDKKTTDEEFEKIKATAKEAGITFNYNRKMNGTELMALSIKMLVKTNSSSAEVRISCNYPKDNDDLVVFGWCEDEQGEFLKFKTGDEADDFHEKYNRDEADFTERYYITAETTEKELRAIFMKAEKAGILLKYSSRYKFKKLTRFEVTVLIGEEGSRNYHHTHFITGVDKNCIIEIKWALDENGKATAVAVEPAVGG